ncbi:hypothetical protein M3B46_10025 [Sphingobacterium daejeonense]|uniref:hypothetical protein n=1 Tax=Sphingobacterium daejeonense TaxID=371142 RepID=UPI0021A8ECCD|nr:hypothetical protein [Sphingobacterium daejeonense]MCT1531333.1 hypothetical protein [Sphingobacterium daejeonense]
MKNQKLKGLLSSQLVKSSSDELKVLSQEELHALQGAGCDTNDCWTYKDGGSGCETNDCWGYTSAS